MWLLDMQVCGPRLEQAAQGKLVIIMISVIPLQMAGLWICPKVSPIKAAILPLSLVRTKYAGSVISIATAISGHTTMTAPQFLCPGYEYLRVLCMHAAQGELARCCACKQALPHV